MASLARRWPTRSPLSASSGSNPSQQPCPSTTSAPSNAPFVSNSASCRRRKAGTDMNFRRTFRKFAVCPRFLSLSLPAFSFAILAPARNVFSPLWTKGRLPPCRRRPRSPLLSHQGQTPPRIRDPNLDPSDRPSPCVVCQPAHHSRAPSSHRQSESHVVTYRTTALHGPICRLNGTLLGGSQYAESG